MSNVNETVSVPEAVDALAQGIKKLLVAVVQNHKALGGNVMAEVSADVTAAVADLGPVMGKVGDVAAEVKADPVGAAESVEVAAVQAVEEIKAAEAPKA